MSLASGGSPDEFGSLLAPAAVREQPAEQYAPMTPHRHLSRDTLSHDHHCYQTVALQPSPSFAANLATSFHSADRQFPAHESLKDHQSPSIHAMQSLAHTVGAQRLLQPANPGLGLDMQAECFARHNLQDSDHASSATDTRDSTLSQPQQADAARQRPSFARHRHSKSQSSMHHPYSGVSSPAPSRSGSIRGLASLHITTPSSPGFVQFPTIMSPSPFRQPTTPTAATMDPSQSVLSRSPSSTSSVSGDFGPAGMSRVGSSSAASSVFGGDTSDVAGLYRSSSTVPSRSARPSLSRRLSSPNKTTRVSKKLNDLDRKAICMFREANPNVKQDDIGSHFGIERSTVSKILKNRLRWLAIPGDVTVDLASTAPDASSGVHEAVLAAESHLSPPELIAQSSERTESEEAGAGSTMPSVSGGRYPFLDNELASWARTQAQFGLLDDETLQSKAKDIAGHIPGCDGFKASNSWLDGFKARAGIENGTFIDTRASPTTVDKLELIVENESDREDTGDFVGRSSRRLRRHVLSTGNRSSSRPTTAKAPTHKSSAELDQAMSDGTHESDLHSTLRHASHFAFDSEATPTHSTTHSRATSGTNEQRMFDALCSYDLSGHLVSDNSGSNVREVDVSTIARPATVPVALSDAGMQRMQSTPLRRPSTQSQLTPLSIDNISPATAPSLNTLMHPTSDSLIRPPHPMYPSGTAQSPFPHSSHQQTGPGSGTHSPAASFQHGRSGSIASTTSSYSGLTAFSSQTGLGTPLTGSMYGSFPTSHSQPNSVPSTPGGTHGLGYFGHGDGTQSQLQAAFVPSRKPSATKTDSPLPTYGMPAQPARRATISGGSPFGGSTSSATVSQAQLSGTAALPSASPAKHTSEAQPFKNRKSAVTLEQARVSLEVAFDYLKSADAQGFAEPKDLLVIWELKEKMGAAAASKKTAIGAAAASPMQLPHSNNKFTLTGTSRRIRLGRTQSASSISSLTSLTGLTSSLGLGSKRSSLFDASMDVTEEPR
ncbi:hypothetical protein OIV83_002796 [Microbotryomycetes sp. JL201]|nr:hypothetical protein OIV83_002796 [Microbotryomycetes sp. JL201]